MRILRRAPLALVPALAALALAPVAPQAVADPTPPAAVTEPAPRAVTRLATDEGTGGAVTSVDPEATRIGLKVLENGGNAVDAAIATAAALGVTEPFSAGIGGGGYLMRLDGKTGKVLTIDGRSAAPARSPKRTMFLDPATGDPYPFFPDLVTSGLAVGTPGTVATWEEARDRWGSQSLRSLLRPAAELARDGFEVDQTFADQVEANAERFAQVRSTAALFLPDGEVPEVGSTFRNPGLAKTYDKLGRQGAKLFYRGSVGRNVVKTVQSPPVLEGELPVPPGHLRAKDLKTYDVRVRKPLTLHYRGFAVHGMGSSSSGGSTVGQALAILERLPLPSWTDDRVQHAVLEASALAFADRPYVGDRGFVKVPDEALLDKEYADERLCAVSMAQATPKPLEPGDVSLYDGRCEPPGEDEGTAVEVEDRVDPQSTHLVVTDRWGTVVSYSMTIEQSGGAGIVVPGRGFLLNNELTDFSLTWKRRDPNRVEPGKRPAGSMVPTIVTEKRKPLVALGSQGGSTAISTMIGLLVDFIDRGETLEDTVAAPRATQRNTVWVDGEPAWLEAWSGDLEPFGHLLRETARPGAEIGAATGIEFLRGKQVVAVAEPVRRGGGDARVVDRN